MFRIAWHPTVFSEFVLRDEGHERDLPLDVLRKYRSTKSATSSAKTSVAQAGDEHNGCVKCSRLVSSYHEWHRRRLMDRLVESVTNQNHNK